LKAPQQAGMIYFSGVNDFEFVISRRTKMRIFTRKTVVVLNAQFSY